MSVPSPDRTAADRRRIVRYGHMEYDPGETKVYNVGASLTYHADHDCPHIANSTYIATEGLSDAQRRSGCVLCDYCTEAADE